MATFPPFFQFFQALWAYEPFPWQRMLAERLVRGEWPKALDLPTAAGKTACIDISLYALAAQAEKPVWERTAPRRIWFVVDRRIVVDEAFERAREIANRLREAKNGPLKAVADRLREVSGTERPLAVARLRGGVLRDDGWARLPSQPAVITSTVDQLGSRLLFRGYGRSALTAPIFAGLAAHDSLILLDEAHLSVPFLQTLRAVECYRGEDWAEQPIRTPYAFSILSATPPQDIRETAVFPGVDRVAALDHPELARRINASKPAELVLMKAGRSQDEDPLVEAAVERATAFVKRADRRRVAVIVNRVHTAESISKALRDQHGGEIDVVLLTGRLRPFERDQVVNLWKPMLKANKPDVPERPVVLVTTQCIEVGADFSFDALVTEAASLDALRQRFGRLNRLGTLESASAAILVRDENAKTGTEDFVYGTTLAECWRLLWDELAETQAEEKRERKVVDFGIAALDSRLQAMDDLAPYLAPAPDAPLLLPSHVDLLCQTSPIPRVEPDIQLYLHGVGRGAPEVRVVWRADLDERNTDNWPETVALCPPNSAETVTVPLYRLRKWLADGADGDDSADVEGVRDSEPQAKERIRPVLQWQRREHSRVCSRASELGPNDVVILPAAYGMDGLAQSAPGQALGEAQLDVWEPSHARSGKPVALRLHRDVLKPWSTCPPLQSLMELAAAPAWESESVRDAIDTVLTYKPESEDNAPALPAWLLALLDQVRDGPCEQHPAGGLVLRARKVESQSEGEQDLFADDDDLLSATGQEVGLDIHSASVERAVDKLAGHCLPGEFREPLKTAAYWHDIGKLDERFQIWLRQGDELAALTAEPLAKSATVPDSLARRSAIRSASGLPELFRHEMLSLQLAECSLPNGNNVELDDLLLHAIASHHGYGRPFSPISPDSAPPAIRAVHSGVTIDVNTEERSAWPAPFGPASGISERFWRLTRRYGWWGLAYLEAILRLGDWYGSRWILDKSPERIDPTPTPLPSKDAGSSSKSLVLKGIDGANPLGFLAALGTLCVLHKAGCNTVKLHWIREFTWNPVLSGLDISKRELAPIIASALHTEKRDELAIGIAENDLKKVIDCDREHFNNVAISALANSSLVNRTTLDFLASFASDACIDKDRKGKPKENKNKKPRLETSPFQFIRGSGQQYFLGTVAQLMLNIDEKKIEAMLFVPWRYEDEKNSMRWDPVEDRRYALMDRDPTASDNKPRTVWMANLLAYRALALFPSAPVRNGLITVGWAQGEKGEPFFTWPIWSHPLDPDSIRSLFLLPGLYIEMPDRAALLARGVEATFRSRRIKVGTGANFKINFSPAREV